MESQAPIKHYQTVGTEFESDDGLAMQCSLRCFWRGLQGDIVNMGLLPGFIQSCATRPGSSGIRPARGWKLEHLYIFEHGKKLNT